MKTADNLNYIFDFDGTIADLKVDWGGLKKEINNICKDFDINLNQTLNTKIDLLKEKMDNHILFDLIKRYEQFNNDTEFSPINSTLNFIYKLDYLYIISNNLHSTIKKTLDKLGIVKKHIIIIGIDDIKKSKPSLHAYKKLQSYLNLKNSIYIGDKQIDLEFANNCQIDFKYIEEI